MEHSRFIDTEVSIDDPYRAMDGTHDSSQSSLSLINIKGCPSSLAAMRRHGRAGREYNHVRGLGLPSSLKLCWSCYSSVKISNDHVCYLFSCIDRDAS